MLNMRGCFATLSGGGEARRGSVDTDPGDAACCCLEGGVRSSGDLNGFLRSGRWRQMGPRVSQASPSQALETTGLSHAQCGLIVNSPGQILSRTLSRALLQRREEARCVCDSCDECCDVNKVQSPRVSRWTGGGAVTRVIMSVSHLWWAMRIAVWTLSSPRCNVMAVMWRVSSAVSHVSRVTRLCYLSCNASRDYWDTRHEVTGRGDISHDNLCLRQKYFKTILSWTVALWRLETIIIFKDIIQTWNGLSLARLCAPSSYLLATPESAGVWWLWCIL